MSGEWKPAPGDVALVRNEYDVWNVAICGVRPGGFVWVYGVADTTAPIAAESRRLVVIDPESIYDQNRLTLALEMYRGYADQVPLTLRSLVATPPKPEVYEHLTAEEFNGVVTAHCGKSWRPQPLSEVEVKGRCPECEDYARKRGWQA